MPHLVRKAELPNSSAFAFASVFAQVLSALAVQGGSAHRAGCIPSLGDPGSCQPLTGLWKLQVGHWGLFTVVRHLPRGI